MSYNKILSLVFSLAFLLAFSSHSVAQMKVNPPHDQFKCQQCHRAQLTEAPKQQVCSGCHGDYPALIAKTKTMKVNPHDSHKGRIECTECHTSHKKPRFMCNDCHAFDGMKMKGE